MLDNEVEILRAQREQNAEKGVHLAELQTAFKESQTDTKIFKDENSLLVVNVHKLEKENLQLKSQLQTACQQEFTKTDEKSSFKGDENKKTLSVDKLRGAVEATQTEIQSFIDANCQLILESQLLQKENAGMTRELQAASQQELMMKNHLKLNIDEKTRLNNLLSEEAKDAYELRQKQTHLKNQEKDLEAKIRVMVEDLRNESQTHGEQKEEERNPCLKTEEKEEEEKDSEEKIELLIKETEEIPNERRTEIANKIKELNKCLPILQQETPKNVKKVKRQKKNNKEKKVKNKKKVEKVKEPKEKPEKRSSFLMFFRRLFAENLKEIRGHSDVNSWVVMATGVGALNNWGHTGRCVF